MVSKYIFAGDRAFVLKKMIDLRLNVVAVYVKQGSYAQKYAELNGIKYFTANNKDDFVEQIDKIDFDYFISNGLWYILPVTYLLRGKKNRKFINIHPSYLPDLRGGNPIVGALLNKRDAGVTCHYMDDGIDTGDIIEHIKIDYSDDLDAGLLYQLAFRAEGDVFELAYRKKFTPSIKQKDAITGNEIYTEKSDDYFVDLKNDTLEHLLLCVRAFSTGTKYARMLLDDMEYRIVTADLINNSYLNMVMEHYKNLDVIFRYDDCIVVKKDNRCLRLRVLRNI